MALKYLFGQMFSQRLCNLAAEGIVNTDEGHFGFSCIPFLPPGILKQLLHLFLFQNLSAGNHFSLHR